MDGFKSGIPPTVAMLMKKNAMLTNIRQNPIEYMSSLLKCMIFLHSSFIKYLGRIADPIKNAMNAMSNVIVRLSDSLFRESKRNPANRIRTINGLKI
jgi:hypothetical protein